MTAPLPIVYPITDARAGRTSHSEQVRAFAEAGASVIQIREKLASPAEFYEAARESVRVAHSLGARLIINDRLDIAMAAGADGVHLGQTDLSPDRARILMGPDAIIGYSTHTLEQALEAVSMAVDYIAVGPIFSTATKENPDPVVGLSLIREVKARVRSPLVAIGGITLERVAEVIAAGADSAAIISDLFVTGDPAGRFLELERAARSG